MPTPEKVSLNLITTRNSALVENQAQDIKEFLAACKPVKPDRLRCRCGNEHFFVTRVDFCCTVCSASYRD